MILVPEHRRAKIAKKGVTQMNASLIGWVNFVSLVVCSIIFSVMYAMSVRPAHLEQKIGVKAYRRCTFYRNIIMIPMMIVLVNYMVYHFYPLPIDPFPARFAWPYSINIMLALILGVPTMIVFIRGILDAGKETLVPDKSHKMYNGIYEKVRHPQALGEAPMWLWFALLLNSPFLTVFSLAYLVVWYWWCVEEEKDLLLRYGDSYAEYMQRTGMFFPRR
jgi:protein-S-isoprenylcysteine O-methyltransferase Ste14